MTEPQLSPGREWWWTGEEWVPAAGNADAQVALAALAAPVPVPVPVPAPIPVQVTAPVAPVVAAVAAPVAAEPAVVTDPPQLSPGGDWWWTGSEWVAAAGHPEAEAARASRVPQQLSVVADPVFAPAVPNVAAPPPWVESPEHRMQPHQPPDVFDTLGLFSILVNFVPLFGLGSVAGYYLSKRADRERLQKGLFPSGMARAGRILSIVFMVLIAVAVVLAVILPLIITISGGGKSTSSGPQRAITRTNIVAMQTDMQTAAATEQSYKAEYDSYAPTGGLLANGYRPTAGVTTVVVHNDANRFCLKSTSGSTTLYYDSRSSLVSSTACG